MSHENDPMLALWFTPKAIREHFEAGEDEFCKWVESATDEQLVVVGENCLSSDILYRTFHEVLELEIEETIKETS